MSLDKLSTSIYDLVLIYVCHFHHHHHHHPVIFLSNHGLSRYSCLYLGSLHPRILLLVPMYVTINKSILAETSCQGAKDWLQEDLWNYNSIITARTIANGLNFSTKITLKLNTMTSKLFDKKLKMRWIDTQERMPSPMIPLLWRFIPLTVRFLYHCL